MPRSHAHPSRRQVLQSVVAVAGGAALNLSQAQAPWPSRPVRLVLPSGAGGGADIFGRQMADYFSKEWGQPVVVENKPGANGVIALEAIARQPGDGHHLVISFAGGIVGNKVMPNKLSVDTVNDFKPIGIISGDGGNLLVANTALPANNLKELMALAKAEKGGLSYGSWGIASGGHLVMESLNVMAGTTMNHVPYKTVAGIPPDLVSGVLKVAAIDAATPVALIKAGRIKALAALSPVRLPQLPDIPTAAEQGFPVEMVPWYGLFGPASMPTDLANRINAVLNKWLVLPETKAFFETKQNNPAPVPKSADEFAAQIQRELPIWRKMMADAKI